MKLNNECFNLSEQQIEMLRGFIKNHDKHKMSICSCDVTRVLNLHDNNLPQPEGSD